MRTLLFVIVPIVSLLLQAASQQHNMPYVGAGERLIDLFPSIEAALFSKEVHVIALPYAGAQHNSQNRLSLQGPGYFTVTNFLGDAACKQMRHESEGLLKDKKFFQNQSEKEDGTRFDKRGVFACELAGDEWGTAAWLLAYTREVVLTLPMMLNMADPHLRISSQAYGGKLAVAVGDGSKYPIHVDNGAGGIGGDLRKVTLVYYLNPGWDAEKDGGSLRIFHGDGEVEDLPPDGDRLVMFWADGVEHEVLPNWGKDVAKHRYAQTIWLTTEDPAQITPSDS
jgi:hypothetical protein